MAAPPLSSGKALVSLPESEPGQELAPGDRSWPLPTLRAAGKIKALADMARCPCGPREETPGIPFFLTLCLNCRAPSDHTHPPGAARASTAPSVHTQHCQSTAKAAAASPPSLSPTWQQAPASLSVLYFAGELVGLVWLMKSCFGFPFGLFRKD